MIFNYELRFVAFTIIKSLLTGLVFTFHCVIVFVGRNFVSGICKLSLKNLKT